MQQRRFRMASADSYPEAVAVKNALVSECSECEYQIRKSRNKFHIVERVRATRAAEETKRRKGK